MPARLILASGSPYRRSLLSRLGLSFEVISPEVDETPHVDETAIATALRLAKDKAMAVARLNPQALIIGADQVAVCEGQTMGKPGNHANALKQLQTLRGRQVVFHTALCLFDGRLDQHRDHEDPLQLANVQTRVNFRNLPDEELDTYLRIEQPYDCAGSAKNEGLGIALLEKIDTDDPTALTGLPLISLCTMLRRVGVTFFA